jgi:hypothetical protein
MQRNIARQHPDHDAEILENVMKILFREDESLLLKRILETL